MAQYFYINQNSELPILRMELIDDGRYEFIKTDKFNNAIQNAAITFSMWDEQGILKISNAPCSIILSEDRGCEDRYIIEYKWKKHDTKKKGQFKGRFDIKFNDDIKDENYSNPYPSGDLIMPIYEDLIIMIK